MQKSWRVFLNRSLPGTCFRGFVLPVLDYSSAVLCPSAYIHLKLLDRAVSGPSFLTGVVFECDIAHRRSVAVLCMLYKIGCDRLYGALQLCRTCQCGLHAAPWSHIGILLRLLKAETRSTEGPLFTSQCPRETILLTLYFDDVGLAGFKSKASAFFIGRSCSIPCCFLYCFSFSLLSVNRLV